MSRQTQYQDRKRVEGKCPVCGEDRDNTTFILCDACRHKARHRYHAKFQVNEEKKESITFFMLSIGFKKVKDTLVGPAEGIYTITADGRVRCGKKYVTQVFMDLMGVKDD